MKFIPKKLFQSLMFIVLPLPPILAVVEWIRDAGVYLMLRNVLPAGIRSEGLAVLLTLLAYYVAALLVVMVLRLFVRDMPSMKAQMAGEAAIIKGEGSLKEKLTAIKAQAEPQTPLQKRALGVVMMALGLVFFLVAIASWLMMEGVVYRFHLALLVLSASCTIAGLIAVLRKQNGVKQ